MGKPLATDAEIRDVRQDIVDHGIVAPRNVSTVRRILARLAAAEKLATQYEAVSEALAERLAASEKECEWRGLLFDATVRGWRIDMQFKSGHDNKVWFLWKQHRDQAFELPMDAQMRPARPSDDVVKRIEEAVNG